MARCGAALQRRSSLCPRVSFLFSFAESATREGGVVLRTGGHQVRRGRDTQPARRRVWLREGAQPFLFFFFFFLLLPVSFERDYLCFLSYASAPTPTPTPAATKASSASSVSLFCLFCFLLPFLNVDPRFLELERKQRGRKQSRGFKNKLISAAIQELDYSTVRQSKKQKEQIMFQFQG